MRTQAAAVALLFLMLAGSVAQSARLAPAVAIVNPEAVRWFPTAFGAIRFAQVQGKWSVPQAIYTVRFLMPNGSAFPVHYHGSDEVLTVIQGTFMVKAGTDTSRTGGRAVKAGGVLFIPANMRHWGWAQSETIVQINGIGPHSVYVLK